MTTFIFIITIASVLGVLSMSSKRSKNIITVDNESVNKNNQFLSEQGVLVAEHNLKILDMNDNRRAENLDLTRIKVKEEDLGNNLNWIGLIASLSTLLITILMFYQYNFSSIHFQFVNEYENIDLIMKSLPYDFYLGADGTSIYFILLTGIIMPIAILSNWNSVKENKRSYIIIMLLLEMLLITVFLVLDTLSFYIFFESILPPLFLLVGFFGSSNKVKASYYLFLYTLLGSLFMLLSILTMTSIMGVSDFNALYKNYFEYSTQIFLFIGIFIAFAVKTPTIFLNTWLLKAHVESPLGGSIILAAIVLKLSLYGIIRLILPILPKVTFNFIPIVYTIAVITIIYASISTLRTVDIKELIAYSSVSHAAVYILGVFSNTVIGIEGAIVLGLAHGFVSSGLFICVGGVLYDRSSTRLITFYRGMTQLMPLFSVLFFILCLGNSGTPLTLNFIGEFMCLYGGFEQLPILGSIACISIVFSAAYTIYMFNRIAFGGYFSKFFKVNIIDITKREAYMLIILVIFTVCLGIFPLPILDGLHYSVSALIYSTPNDYNLIYSSLAILITSKCKKNPTCINTEYRYFSTTLPRLANDSDQENNEQINENKSNVNSPNSNENEDNISVDSNSSDPSSFVKSDQYVEYAENRLEVRLVDMTIDKGDRRYTVEKEEAIERIIEDTNNRVSHSINAIRDLDSNNPASLEQARAINEHIESIYENNFITIDNIKRSDIITGDLILTNNIMDDISIGDDSMSDDSLNDLMSEDSLSENSDRYFSDIEEDSVTGNDPEKIDYDSVANINITDNNQEAGPSTKKEENPEEEIQEKSSTKSVGISENNNTSETPATLVKESDINTTEEKSGSKRKRISEEETAEAEPSTKRRRFSTEDKADDIDNSADTSLKRKRDTDNNDEDSDNLPEYTGKGKARRIYKDYTDSNDSNNRPGASGGTGGAGPSGNTGPSGSSGAGGNTGVSSNREYNFENIHFESYLVGSVIEDPDHFKNIHFKNKDIWYVDYSRSPYYYTNDNKGWLIKLIDYLGEFDDTDIFDIF